MNAHISVYAKLLFMFGFCGTLSQNTSYDAIKLLVESVIIAAYFNKAQACRLT